MTDPDDGNTYEILTKLMAKHTQEKLNKINQCITEENVTPTDFGMEESLKAINVASAINPTPTIEVDPDDGTNDDVVNDHRLSTVKPAKVYTPDIPIEYLINPKSGKIFPVNDDIVKQKRLKPCNREGKLLPDQRT